MKQLSKNQIIRDINNKINDYIKKYKKQNNIESDNDYIKGIYFCKDLMLLILNDKINNIQKRIEKERNKLDKEIVNFKKGKLTLWNKLKILFR